MEKLTKENFGGMDIAEMLVSAGLAPTRTAARRSVKDGAIRLNGIQIKDQFARVAVLDGQMFILENVGQGSW
jgi:tyrosyl-tRNA synthetase